MKKENKTFGAKLYKMFLISIGIPVIIAMVCFWIYSNHLAFEREEKNIQNILNSVSQNLELQFSEIDSVRKAFYVHKKVFQTAENMNNPRLYENYDELTRIDMQNTYEVTMTKLLNTTAQTIRAVVFFPASGEDQAYYLGKDNAKIELIHYPDYKNEAWYQEGIKAVENPYYYALHMPQYLPNKKLGEVYSCISAVRNMDSKKIIGVVKIDVDKKNLQNTLDMLENTDENGLVLIQDCCVFARSGDLGRIEKMDDHSMIIDSRKYQAVTQKVPGTDITVAYVYSPFSIYRYFAVVILLSIFIMAVGLLLAFFNYRYQAKKIVADVQKITKVIRKVEKGELNTYIEIQDKSEFGEIAAVINQMIDNLKEYIEKEYILVIQQQKAEYKALQSQINPHFLYNTLNGFVALNRMGDKKTLERSIIGLSKLFRYVCSKQEMVQVENEMDFLQEYLKLEKLKYEDRLEYMVWVDEECRNFEIPKLLLQPVVENSIKHGMGDSDQPIMIRISAMSSEVKGIGKIVILTVRDNGVGFDSNTGVNGLGVGIENVRIRAELYCKDVIYQCTSEEGQGTKTTFIFPDERQEEL